jgi:hypothetical protein
MGGSTANALNNLVERIELMHQNLLLQPGAGIDVSRGEGGQTVSLSRIDVDAEETTDGPESWDHTIAPNAIDPVNDIDVQIQPGILSNLVATNWTSAWAGGAIVVASTGTLYSKLKIESLDGVVSSFEHVIDADPPVAAVSATLPSVLFEFPLGIIVDGVFTKLVSGNPITARPIEVFRLPKAGGTYGFGEMPFEIYYNWEVKQ